MSQANAAAIRRRAPTDTSRVNPAQTKPAQPTQSNVNSVGLTLPQVISLVDKRLITLEDFMKESKESNENLSKSVRFEQPMNNTVTPTNLVQMEAFSNVVDEFNHRFELLAGELDIMKDIVLKLQSFTMEVNKTLMNERIQILSELGNHQPDNTDEPELGNDQTELGNDEPELGNDEPELGNDQPDNTDALTSENVHFHLQSDDKDENTNVAREFI